MATLEHYHYERLERESAAARSRSSTWPLQEPAPLGNGIPNPEQQGQHGVKSETPDCEQCESPIPGQQPGKSEPNKKMRNAWGNMSYAELITQAILSTPDKRLTLSEIYDWIVKNVHYFADKANSPSTAGWKVTERSLS